MSTPQESPLTNDVKMVVTWDFIEVDALTGASPIVSYSLEWDQGSGNWQPLIGVASDSLALTGTVQGGITPGLPYNFRVRAKNIHGWGPYGGTLKVIPSNVPSMMLPVATVVSNIYVKISWVRPTENGASITAYKIMIMKGDGTFSASTSCDGSLTLLINQLYCMVPMSELTGAFELPYASLIVAKV